MASKQEYLQIIEDKLEEKSGKGSGSSQTSKDTERGDSNVPTKKRYR